MVFSSKNAFISVQIALACDEFQAIRLSDLVTCHHVDPSHPPTCNPSARTCTACIAPDEAGSAGLCSPAPLTPEDRAPPPPGRRRWVERMRADTRPGLMEVFLAEYGLSTEEGVALMCLAEALLRVPDAETIDALIEDKIAPSEWGAHLGRSSSPLVNASTWALMLTGRVLRDDPEPGVAATLRGASSGWASR
jgi:RHH-type proline utilization regulon transcriptional repressor/proline dehydrogenase/delta 1-pyrroline-5-carboxylate dehydrogenase